MKYYIFFLTLICGCADSSRKKDVASDPAKKEKPAIKPDTTTKVVFAENLPSLILSPGETRVMPAQRYEYEKVTIPAGATLKITEGGMSVLHLVIKDSFLFQGRIEATGFNSQERQEYFNIPGQSPVMVEFRNTNKGGDGGRGGLGGSNTGGSGALGNTSYGGGGGSGGGRLSQAAQPYITNFRGLNANGWAGAGPPGYCGAAGGNGAKREDYGNGGVIYFEVYGHFDGTNGFIDVTGKPGRSGTNGGRGFSSNMTHGCQTGGGGGGGGAPGGHGGFVVGYFAGDVVNYPRASVRGGVGGTAGTAPGEQGRQGTPGADGEAGVSGRVMYFKKP